MKTTEKNTIPEAESLSALVAKAKTGDQEAFSELYDKTSAELYRCIRAMTRDEDLSWDIQQDAYLHAYQKLDTLDNNEAFFPWLRRIAVNATVSRMRQRRVLTGRLLAGALAVALIGGGIWGGAKLLKSKQRDNPYQPTTVETNERLSGVEPPEEISETNKDLPVITEPAATEPVVTEPTVTDPAATEPTTTEVVTTEPSEPTEPTEPDAYSGSYGENLTWRFDPNTGLLTIEGSGAMADNTDSEEYPWFTYRDVITGVVFSEGLTTVGRVAFEAYDNLPSVQFPEGLTFIDGEAFLDCPNLLSVTIPSGVTNIYDQTCGYVITARHSPNSTDPMEDFTIYGAEFRCPRTKYGSGAHRCATVRGSEFRARAGQETVPLSLPLSRKKVLDKYRITCIMMAQLNSLIKSGGGNGPVKPGNLQDRKVPNPARKSADEDMTRHHPVE